MNDNDGDESIRAASLAHAKDVRLILVRARPPRWAVRCTDCGREFAAATPRVKGMPLCPDCAGPDNQLPPAS